jgi:hypothetical protein
MGFFFFSKNLGSSMCAADKCRGGNGNLSVLRLREPLIFLILVPFLSARW